MRLGALVCWGATIAGSFSSVSLKFKNRGNRYNNLIVLLLRRHSASNPKRPRVLWQTDSVVSQIITIIHGCQRLATLTHRNQAHHSQIKGAGLVPVRMRSILSATRSASSGVKHMGGLNLRTLRWGPSVLRRIFSSFSLKHGVYYPFIIVYYRQSVDNLVNKQGPSVNNNVIIPPININNR